MSRSDDRSTLTGWLGRKRAVVTRLARRKDPFTWVTALLPALISVTYFVDYLSRADATHYRFVIACTFALISAAVLLAGRTLAPRVGLVVLSLIAASSVLVSRDVHPHSEVNILLITPVIGLYLGWFYRAGVSRGFGALFLAVLVFAVLSTGGAESDGFSAPVGVGYTVFIAAFCLETAAYLRRKLAQEAILDPLTRVLNRRGLIELGGPMIAEARKRGAPITLAVVDFDDFKAVNDTGGHAAGDRALCEAAQSWVEDLGPENLVARIGGDEFVLLIHADLEQANALLSVTRARASSPWSWGSTQIRPDDTLDDLMKRADTRMYRAKGDREQ